jgi:hypothetical protein
MLHFQTVLATGQMKHQLTAGEAMINIIRAAHYLFFTHIIIVMSKWDINLNQLKAHKLPAPFGYSLDHSLENKNKSSSEHKTLLEKVSKSNMQKLMGIAIANKMQIVMSIFMMWMLGNAVNIFSYF